MRRQHNDREAQMAAPMLTPGVAFLAGLLLAGLPSLGRSQDTPIEVPRLAQTPVIDGAVDEWRDLAFSDGVWTMDPWGRSAAHLGTGHAGRRPVGGGSPGGCAAAFADRPSAFTSPCPDALEAPLFVLHAAFSQPAVDQVPAFQQWRVAEKGKLMLVRLQAVAAGKDGPRRKNASRTRIYRDHLEMLATPTRADSARAPS